MVLLGLHLVELVVNQGLHCPLLKELVSFKKKIIHYTFNIIFITLILERQSSAGPGGIVRPNVCEKCGRAYAYKGSLINHMSECGMDSPYRPEPASQLPAHIPDVDDNQGDTNSDNPDGDISEDGAAGPSSGRKPRTSLPTAKAISKYNKYKFIKII